MAAGKADIPANLAEPLRRAALLPAPRNVESLLLTAQQQQLRHLKRLQQVRRGTHRNCWASARGVGVNPGLARLARRRAPPRVSPMPQAPFLFAPALALPP